MAKAADIMLTAEELRLRTRKRKRLAIVLVLLVVLLLGGIFGGRPAMHEIKAWQARRHARKAFALLEKEQWNEARKEATAAYQLWPAEPEAIRAVARFLSRTRQAQALEFWDLLMKESQLTRADLREEASIALVAGDDARATRVIRAILSGQNGPVTAGDQLLSAQLSLRTGATIEAHDAVLKVYADTQATSREKLQAALLELAISGGNEAWRGEAWSWLKKVANEKDAASVDALLVLGQTALGAEKLPDNFPFSGPDLAQTLETHPLARAPHKLLAVDLKIREHREQRAELIAQAIAQWKDAEPEETAVLATWLNGKGEFQLLLDAIPLEKAITARELFLQYVDALGGLGRWSEIKELLDRDRYPLDPMVQKMYLARCNAQLGEKAASENNWQRALEAGHGDPGKLVTLGSYAEKNGALEVAGAAYDEAAAESPKLRAAQQGRLNIAQASRETKKIHAVLADMLAVWPNDPAVLNDEAYTRLLLIPSEPAPADQPSTTSEIEGIEQLAAKLVERDPGSLPHRSLLALARLRLRRYAGAMEAYANIQASRSALTPSALAVHAAVLAANGRADDAATEIREIDMKRLLPEEATLIAGIPR